MATEIFLVKVGMSMTEGVVDEWYVNDGDRVEVGELLYRLETEKVNLDVDAEVAGVVKHLIGEGITKEPGDVVGYIFAIDEEIPDDLSALAGSPAQAPATTKQASDTPIQTTPTSVNTESGDQVKASPTARRLARELGVDYTTLSGSGPGGRIIEADVQAAADTVQPTENAVSPSSPIARKLARELGVDLSLIKGTGPGGRITKEDVEAAVQSTSSSPPMAARESTGLPIRGMRKTIAERMHASLMEMAQLTMDMDVNMDDAIKLRGQLVDEWAGQGVKPTYTDIVIRATAKALETHPLINASWGEKEIELHGEVNIGMAVSLDEGLIVPVLHNANLISMKELAALSSRLAEAARNNALALDDLQGGTFTVSALGMMGVDAFTPIINSPQAGILGVNRIRDEVAWEGERPYKTQVMRLSLTWDHRVLDGAPAAAFLGEVKTLLEAPYRLLL
ncbi:MAG: 2-oxo acid dehydrogenase subunit E2 [Pseudomonadota bacterium]|nr:2-oxo acid dehydrogenase subunit E2 [Pseudomonadota bacterium]